MHICIILIKSKVVVYFRVRPSSTSTECLELKLVVELHLNTSAVLEHSITVYNDNYLYLLLYKECVD